VGDATGELADGFHLMALVQLALEEFCLSNILAITAAPTMRLLAPRIGEIKRKRG